MEAEIDLGIPGLSDLREIGRGGSAVVYRAWQERLKRHVAVKVVHASAEEGAARRFDRELAAMGRLSEHPGIAQVHATGQTRTGELYLIMPFYSAGALSDRITPSEPMAWEEAVELMDAVGSTIGDAHEIGIVHRDIKPANILLTSTGEPRVADFGIAVLAAADQSAQSTTPTFTPYFAAPESFQTSSVSTAIDVYSLGATLYALIAGQPPFRSAVLPNDILSVMKRATDEPADDLGPPVPSAIAALVRRAMAKDPAQRPRDGHAFVAELRAAVSEARTGEPAMTIIPDDAPLWSEASPAKASASGSIVETDSELSDEARKVKGRSHRKLLSGAAVALSLALGVLGLIALLGNGGSESEAASASVEAGAPRIIGLDVVDLTDTTARVVYRGNVCTGTTFVIEGVGQGGSGYPTQNNCNDNHQLLLGRAPFTPGLLQPDTEYTVQVTVHDEEGRSSAVESVRFRTDELYPEERPVVISGFSLTDLTDSSVKVSFSTDLCAGSRFYVDGELVHGDGYPDNAWCWNRHSYLIGITSDPLAPNTSHVARVEAVSRSGVVTEFERAFTTAP